MVFDPVEPKPHAAVIPARAGIQGQARGPSTLIPRFRGDDARRLEGRRPGAPATLFSLFLISALAFALGAGTFGGSLICGLPASLAALDLEVVIAPWRFVASWLLMLALMTPMLLIGPVRYLWAKSFADRRWPTIFLFAASYTAVWTAAGAPFLIAAQLARSSAPVGMLLTAALCAAWQISPAKQACLNRCHRRPVLAAYGLAATRDALVYGATHGAWCLGACWPLMLFALLPAHGQPWVMMATALYLCAERLEPPAALAWRWPAPRRAIRIVSAFARAASRGHETREPQSNQRSGGSVDSLRLVREG